MPYREGEIKPSLELPDVLMINGKKVEEIFHAARDRRSVAAIARYNIEALFDSSQRLLSEMPLCYAVKDIPEAIALPPGVEVVTGSLTVLDSDMTLHQIFPHYYFVQGASEPSNDMIGCLTTAQVVDQDKKGLRPGERIQYLAELASDNGYPQAVRQITQQLTLVWARRIDFPLLFQGGYIMTVNDLPNTKK